MNLGCTKGTLPTPPPPLLPPQQLLGQSCHGGNSLLSRTASRCQKHLGQVKDPQLMVPPGLPHASNQPCTDRKCSDVPPIQNMPSGNLSPDNLAVSSQKVRTKPVPRAPLGTSSGRPDPHLHTVPTSSVAWFPSCQQIENSKIRRGRETYRARQTDVRRSDR